MSADEILRGLAREANSAGVLWINPPTSCAADALEAAREAVATLGKAARPPRRATRLDARERARRAAIQGKAAAAALARAAWTSDDPDDHVVIQGVAAAVAAEAAAALAALAPDDVDAAAAATLARSRAATAWSAVLALPDSRRGA